MTPDLDALKALQEVDTRIRAILREAENHPARIAEIEADLAQRRAALDAARGRLAEVERNRRAHEQLIASEREKIKKWEARLAEIRTPREYAALSREIDIAKKANRTLEDEALEMMAEAERVLEEIRGLEADVQARTATAEPEVAQLRAGIAEAEQRAAALKQQREALARSVPADLLRRYDQARGRRGGLGIVPVRDGICRGCHMNLPPQFYTRLVSGREVLSCPTCHRILYIPSEPESAPLGE